MENLTGAQIETLARPLVNMVETILGYYQDPKNEAAFREWYLKEYGHPAPEGVSNLPKTRRPLNEVGIWLNNELAQRNILLFDFAATIGTTPQNLSYVMRNDVLSEATMANWRKRFEEALGVQKGD